MIGWGLADVEFRLAIKFSNINFLCTDISSVIPSLKKIAEQLNINNIKFDDLDFQEKNIDENFDIVYSQSVIYCLKTNEVSRYLKSLFSNLERDGIVVIGSSSNLSFLLKLSNIF